MKLLIATPLYPPEIGGPATYAKLLEDGLPKMGIEVDLVKFSEVRHLPKIIRHFAYYRRVLRALRSADAVLALDPVSVGLPAIWAAQKAGKPLVVKIVGDYAWEQGQQRFGVSQTLDEFVKTKDVPFFVRILRRIQTLVGMRAALILVPSEYLKSVVGTWGIEDDKIRVIYNAVTLEEIGTVSEEIQKLPRPVVVTAGRLVPWKNVNGIIDAVANIPGVSLVVIGDGHERMALMRHAEEKLKGRVFFTGMLSHKDTLATVQSSDAFVLNSSYEGLSHLLIEAQALGVPIIATRVGGNPEVITHDKDGLLVPCGDTALLTEALSCVCCDEELRVRLSTSAIESAKRFSTETMLSATTAALQNI